jgi:DNA-binding Lrp family transcriptional regulator
MTTSTKSDLLKYLQKHNYATAKELAEVLGISPQALFRHIKTLLQKGDIVKTGSAPKVYYKIGITKTIAVTEDVNVIDEGTKKIIDNNFLIVTPTGEMKEGLEGFSYWTSKTNQDFHKTALEYIKTLDKYNKFKVKGLIDGSEKISTTFEKSYLDKTFYLDFYAIERFGKTRLGSLILYAKQSQNKDLIQKVCDITKASIEDLIKRYKIDAVGFIPPTVPRNLQFMIEFKKMLKLQIPLLEIQKPNQYIPVAQKTLSKLSDRVENARDSIFVSNDKVYKNVLLIDDAVGSGSTLNETAKKIRDRKIAKGKIIGLALVGSYKGFEVINEI